MQIRGEPLTIAGMTSNDLALIQIDARDDLPTLSWYDGEPTVGLEVYAAGFPWAIRSAR